MLLNRDLNNQRDVLQLIKTKLFELYKSVIPIWIF